MESQSSVLGYEVPANVQALPVARTRGIVGVVVAVSIGLVMVLGALVIGTNNCRCLYRRLTKTTRGKSKKRA